MVYNAIRKALYEYCSTHTRHLRIAIAVAYSLGQATYQHYAAASTFIIRYLDRKSKPLS